MSDSFSLPSGFAWVEIPEAIGASLWSVAIVKGDKQRDAEGAEICVYFAKAGAPRYIRRWKGKDGRWHYAYASKSGAIGAAHFNDPSHFHEGARFAHGAGHYEVHGKDEHGNLTLTHSDDPTKQVKMHADQFAAHLKEHHAAAIDKHRSKLLADLGEAHLHGKGKQVERLSKEAERHGYGLPERPEGARSKIEEAAARLKETAHAKDMAGKPMDVSSRHAENVKANQKLVDGDYDFSGGAPGPGKEAKAPEQKPATFPQSRIEHSLDSSNLERVSWDPEKPGSAKGTMKVHFKGGDAGEHPNVHHDDYMKVVNAHGSHGKAYNEHIKGMHDYVAKRVATPEDKKETSARGSETRAMNNDRQQKAASEFMAQKEGKPASRIEETAAKLKGETQPMEAKPAEAKAEAAPSKVDQAAAKLKESAGLTPNRFEKLDPKKFDANGNPRVPKGEAKAEAPAKAVEPAKQSEETSTAAYTDSGRPVPKWLAESNKIAAERHPDIQDALDGRLPPSGPLHDAMRGYLKSAQDSAAWHREQRKSGVDAGTMSHQGDHYFAKRKSLQEDGAKASAKLHETLTAMGAHPNDVEDVARKLGANQSPANWLPPKERVASKVDQAAAAIKEKAAAPTKPVEPAPAAKTPEPTPEKAPAPAKEAPAATTATPSASDVLAQAKQTYGLNDKEHALVEKKAHDLGKHLAAGDTEKANAHVKQSVESVLAGMRNMSPSSARRHMKEAEAKAAPKAPKAEKKAKDESAPAKKEAAKTEAPAKAEAPTKTEPAPKTDAQKKAEQYAEKARFQKEMDRRIKENMTKPDDGSDPFAGIEGADKPAPYGTSQRVSEAFPEAPKKEASKVEQAAEKIKAEARKEAPAAHADVANESDRSKLRTMSASQSKIMNDPSASRDAVRSASDKWEAIQNRIEHLSKQEYEERHKKEMAESEARQADYNAKYTARQEAISAMGDPAFRRAMKFAHKTKTRWDKARPELQGVYVKDGVGYATDGHRAIAFPAKGVKDGFVHEHGPSDAGEPEHGAKLEKLMTVPEHGHESSHTVKDVREWTKAGAHVKLGSDKYNAPMVPSEQLKQAIEAAPGKVRIITNGATQPVHIIRSDGERHIIMPVDPKTLDMAGSAATASPSSGAEPKTQSRVEQAAAKIKEAAAASPEPANKEAPATNAPAKDPPAASNGEPPKPPEKPPEPPSGGGEPPKGEPPKSPKVETLHYHEKEGRGDTSPEPGHIFEDHGGKHYVALDKKSHRLSRREKSDWEDNGNFGVAAHHEVKAREATPEEAAKYKEWNKRREEHKSKRETSGKALDEAFGAVHAAGKRQPEDQRPTLTGEELKDPRKKGPLSSPDSFHIDKDAGTISVHHPGSYDDYRSATYTAPHTPELEKKIRDAVSDHEKYQKPFGEPRPTVEVPKPKAPEPKAKEAASPAPKPAAAPSSPAPQSSGGAKLQYRKTREGDWAVFGPASHLKEGKTHEVHTKSGEVKHEHVHKVSRPFDINGVPHAYGYIKKAADEYTPEQIAAVNDWLAKLSGARQTSAVDAE